TIKRRFAGQVRALIGQDGHDLRGGHVRKARLHTGGQHGLLLKLAELVAGRCAFGLRAAISSYAIATHPALIRAQAQACGSTRCTQASSISLSLLDHLDELLAFHMRGHAPSSLLLWNASSFFVSTSSAAASARAFSLRRNSRSSSRL